MDLVFRFNLCQLAIFVHHQLCSRLRLALDQLVRRQLEKEFE